MFGSEKSAVVVVGAVVSLCFPITRTAYKMLLTIGHPFMVRVVTVSDNCLWMGTSDHQMTANITILSPYFSLCSLHQLFALLSYNQLKLPLLIAAA